MKTIPLFLLLPACAFACFVARAFAGTNVIAEWTAELNTVQQTSGQDTGGRERADEILSAALVSAMTGLEPNKDSGRAAETPPAGANLDVAAAQAAHATMVVLYPGQKAALDAQLTESLSGVDDSESVIVAGKEWGNHVAQVVLAEHETSVLLNSRSFARAVMSPATLSLVDDIQAHEELAAEGTYRFDILAGAPGIQGHVDGAGEVARFDNPGEIAVDTAGNVYVSEPTLHTLRKITPAGVVTTIAGAVGMKGSQDGVGAAAQFNQPRGLAVDRAGNVYVADSGNSTIRKVDPVGRVTTLAGSVGNPGHVNGPRESALFGYPSHVAVDDGENVFVSDGSGIRKVAKDGTVSTLQLEIPPVPFSDPWPEALCVDHAGYLYVIMADPWGGISDVVKFTPSSSGRYSGTTLRPDPQVWAKLSYPFATAAGLGLDRAGNLYVTYDFNPIVVYTPAGETHVRYATYEPEVVDGSCLAVDEDGSLYLLPGAAWGDSDKTVRFASFETDATTLVIRQHPYSQSKFIGDSVKFSVEAGGVDPLLYQWYFNSNPIAGANQPTLELSGAQVKDTGSYYVVVSDSNGSTTSRTAALKLTERVQTGVQTTGTNTQGLGSSNASSGGGSLENWFSLPVLVLLAAAAFRPRQPGNAAAKTSGI